MTTVHEGSTSPSMSPSTKKMSRRFSGRRPRADSHLDIIHQEAMSKIRTFLKSRSAFDVFPLSYKVVVFDTKLPVKHALNTMHAQGEQCTFQVDEVLTMTQESYLHPCMIRRNGSLREC
jgi:5'-AMP-activated protein kinase regulatory gamma subunit